jgi:hypothetical protein
VNTFQRHMAALQAGQVTKTNVIGLRKAINAHEIYNGRGTAVTFNELDALETQLSNRSPDVTGELHESGLKVLRSPRYAKRWSEAQRAIIDRLEKFQLVRFDRIGSNRRWQAVPVYRAVASTGQSFCFRNIPWQTAYYMGEESGPVAVEEYGK